MYKMATVMCEPRPIKIIINRAATELPSEDHIEPKFVNGYGEWSHVVVKTERTIIPDLKSYPFTDDIKYTADVIYNKMTNHVHRGKIRTQMLFYCVYCAHLELNRSVNPTQLGAVFGLTQGEVQKCDSLFSPLQTNYTPPIPNATPLNYLPDYCRQLNLTQEAIDEINEITKSILTKQVALLQENPQTVAAGILRYYTMTRGIITDDASKLSKITGRSNATIETMCKRVVIIDNN